MEQEEGQRVSEGEINLYDFVKVIWKRKFLITAIFLLSVAVTAVICYTMKPVWCVSAAVSPGVFYDTAGNITSVDSPENVMALIQSGSLNSESMKSLNLDPGLYSAINFKAQIPKGSNVINLTYETVNPEHGEKVVHAFLNKLSNFYTQKAIDTHKEKMEMAIEGFENEELKIDSKKEQGLNERKRISSDIQILEEKTQMKKEQGLNEKKKISNDIQILEEKTQMKKEQGLNEKKKISSDIQLLKDKLTLLRETEISLNKQKQEAEDNSRKLMEQREQLLRETGKADPLALLLYSNTLQQNIAYSNQLRESLYRNKLEQDAAKNEVEKLEVRLKEEDLKMKDFDAKREIQNLMVRLKEEDLKMKDLDAKREIQNLMVRLKEKDLEMKNLKTDILSQKAKIGHIQLDSNKIQGIRVLQNATISATPVRPRKKITIAIAGILSLFIGVFTAFVVECVQTQKKKCTP